MLLYIPTATNIHLSDNMRSMIPVTDSFEFDYAGSELVYGRGCVETLEKHLSERGLSRGLVVCGTNVGANEDVMRPVKRGLGDRLVGVFDETTPAKSAETVYDGIEMMLERNPDFLVGVGGGSSLDTARQMSAFAADGRPLSEFRSAAREGHILSVEPEGTTTSVIVVPTTFAGADISAGGSIEFLPAAESPTGQPIRISGSVLPEVVAYDPNLFETTPMSSLAGSAMNGFNKGLETIYARNATPISDATAIHGLRLLREGFPNLTDSPDAFDRAVVGIILVQLERQITVIHAFGHGFARRYPVQQGVIHAILVPHVLRYIFENVDGQRELIAEGLDIDTSDSGIEVAERIVNAVITVRDSFDLPTRLRDVEPVNEEDIPAIAEFILTDDAIERAPAGLDPSVDEIENVLRNAW